MPRLLRSLAALSPARVGALLARPGMIPVLLRAPRPVASVDALCTLMPEADRAEVEDRRIEFLSQHTLIEELNRAMVARRRRWVVYREWYEFLYMLVRFARPRVMIETGVFDGQSSAVILQAMEHNGCGELRSIDLPAKEAIAGSTHRMQESALPPGCDPGWLVPQRLRGRYRLELGDARVLLPALVRSSAPLDIFFHDSLHTYEHMTFEYTTAWPAIADGGFLISDDILWNAAFDEFCRSQGRRFVRVGGFGALRKTA